MLGLGLGTVAALTREGDSLRFYEINPQVIALARGEGGYFHFLADSPAKVEVVEGDARLSLAQEKEGEAQVDLLAIDTFSGDAVPVHLLTAEAFSLYLRRLRPAGLLAVHISNRHLELSRVVFGLARTLGVYATLIDDPGGENGSRSVWAILGRDPEHFAPGRFVTQSGTRLDAAVGPEVIWTDDFSSLLAVLRTSDLL